MSERQVAGGQIGQITYQRSELLAGCGDYQRNSDSAGERAGENNGEYVRGKKVSVMHVREKKGNNCNHHDGEKQKCAVIKLFTKKNGEDNNQHHRYEGGDYGAFSVRYGVKRGGIVVRGTADGVHLVPVQRDGGQQRTPYESSYDEIVTEVGKNDTYGVSEIINRIYTSYGDNEVRARKIERIGVSYDRSNDWANPGFQSKNHSGSCDFVKEDGE